MTYSKDADALELMVDSGLDVPAISQRPSLTGLEWLWLAFIDLSTCRSIGMSVGPIPWIAVDQYSTANQLSQSDRWMLHRVISRMDGVYMSHQQEKKSG